jgi:acetoin utilization protein AcuB
MGREECSRRASGNPHANAARFAALEPEAQRVRENVAEPTNRRSADGGTLGAAGPSMLMPSIDRYMTREPYSVASTENLSRVRHLMLAHSIRHLPVIDGGRLVGVVGDRDVIAVESVPGIDLAHVEVSRVMSKPVQVWGETPLDEVSELMTKRKADCVVVQGGHGVQGIFTSSDAISALTDLLRRATA